MESGPVSYTHLDVYKRQDVLTLTDAAQVISNALPNTPEFDAAASLLRDALLGERLPALEVCYATLRSGVVMIDQDRTTLLQTDFQKWEKEQTVEAAPNQWPWGNYETDLLRKLAAAAKKFWTLYDPNDPTTAPTNKQVQDWLQKEMEVSSRVAEVIAQILRTDGLPSGPRKS